MNEHFIALVLGLVQQAKSALAGELPSGAEGLATPREAARRLIDTLAMLEEKTSGNLGPPEAQLLAGALTELRIEFVTGESA